LDVSQRSPGVEFSRLESLIQDQGNLERDAVKYQEKYALSQKPAVHRRRAAMQDEGRVEIKQRAGLSEKMTAP
jgi:hypothetical protein